MKEQFVELRGINPDNVAYGGWGYGEPDLPFGTHGHVDLSHTRRIIESLLIAKSIPVKDSLSDQLQYSPPLKGVGGLFIVDHSQSLTNSQSCTSSVSTFLHSVQRSPEDPRLYEGCTSRKDLPYDGGFVSSVATLATNKCEPVFIKDAGYHYPSYATATCDGLLALLALGMKYSQAYKDAVQWLAKNQNMNTIDEL